MSRWFEYSVCLELHRRVLVTQASAWSTPAAVAAAILSSARALRPSTDDELVVDRQDSVDSLLSCPRLLRPKSSQPVVP